MHITHTQHTLYPFIDAQLTDFKHEIGLTDDLKIVFGTETTMTSFLYSRVFQPQLKVQTLDIGPGTLVNGGGRGRARVTHQQQQVPVPSVQLHHLRGMVRVPGSPVISVGRRRRGRECQDQSCRRMIHDDEGCFMTARDATMPPMRQGQGHTLASPARLRVRTP